MGLRLSKLAGDEDTRRLRSENTEGHSNRTNPEEEYYYHEHANPEALPPVNLPGNVNGVSDFRTPEHEVNSFVVQVENEPLPNDAPESGGQIERSNLAHAFSLQSATGTATGTTQGNAAQANGSGNEGDGNQLEGMRTFAHWTGGLTFAACIAMIAARVGTSSLGNRKRNELNASVACMACAFFLSMFLLLVSGDRPIYSGGFPMGAARGLIGLTGFLVVLGLVLGLTLLY